MTARWSPSDERLARARLTSQGLAGRTASTVAEVAGRLLAVQAQDPRGFRLSVRARTAGLSAADVDVALTQERSVIVGWLNRGTLHLVAASDYWWLHALTTPQLATGNRRRLQQEGVTPAAAERGIDVVRQAVASGPKTRDELRAVLDDASVPTARQALVHVLFAASIVGDLIRGPMVGKEHAFVSAADWIGPRPPVLDGDDALALLARRYLVGHGPATPRDLSQWAGVTLGAARRALAAVTSEVARFGDESELVLRGALRPARLPKPRLLGPFDPILHGWASRGLFVGDHGGVVTSNGVFRPTALVDGRVVATWALASGVVTITPLESLAPPIVDTLEREAAAVLQYLGLPDRPAVLASAR